MKIEALGPKGVQERIQELQAKLDQVITPSSQKNDQPNGFGDILQQLGNNQPLPMQEKIPELCGPITGLNSNQYIAPINPFGRDVRVHFTPAPPHLQPLIHDAAQKAGIDPHLFESLVATESDFRPGLVSHKGAIGLSQLMPSTAKGLGVSDPLDISQNLHGGARYLANQMKRFNQDPRLALAAYNAGPGAVKRHGGIPPYIETQNYVQKVMARYNAAKNSVS